MEINPSFYCFICDKTIGDNQDQYYHFESHILHKPFKCLDCGFDCSSKIELENHLKFFKHLNYQRETKLGLRKFIDSLKSFSDKMRNVNDTEIFSIDLVINESRGNYLTHMESNRQDITHENEIFNVKSESMVEESIDEIETYNYSEIFETPTLTANISLPFVNDCTDYDKKQINMPEQEKKFKINNSGYLDLDILNGKPFRQKYKIPLLCKICNEPCPSSYDKIVHVFKEHLKIRNYRFLRCAICLKKKIKGRDYLDFGSVKHHYKSAKKDHNYVPFENNLESSYEGNGEFVYFKGNNKILHDYEEEFERCFVGIK